MNESISHTTAGAHATQGRCAQHPERTAAGICDRCGSYYCPECVKTLAGKRLCSSCLAIPGVDYLAETRAKFWGKRDGWVWYFGLLGTSGMLVATVEALLRQATLNALIGAVAVAVNASYFMLKPWSRKALFALFPLYAINTWSNIQAQGGSVTEELAAVAASGGAMLFVLFVGAAYADPRNRLAFKLDVPDEALARYYVARLSNPSARRALAYGLMSIPIFLCAPFALVFGVLAWRRADSKAWPPRGGRGMAVAGMLLGLAGVVEAIAIINLMTP